MYDGGGQRDGLLLAVRKADPQSIYREVQSIYRVSCRFIYKEVRNKSHMNLVTGMEP